MKHTVARRRRRGRVRRTLTMTSMAGGGSPAGMASGKRPVSLYEMSIMSFSVITLVRYAPLNAIICRTTGPIFAPADLINSMQFE